MAQHMCRSQRITFKNLFSLCIMGSGDQSQVIRSAQVLLPTELYH